MSKLILQLKCPPTVNTYYRHITKGPLAGRTLISERGREYRKSVEFYVAVNRLKAGITGPISVDIEFRAPDRRKRDLDNLTKSLLDALTHAGVWVDDSQIDDLRIWRSTQNTGCVMVTIRELPAIGQSALFDRIA